MNLIETSVLVLFLFYVWILSRDIKEDTPARYFIKVTPRPRLCTINSDKANE